MTTANASLRALLIYALVLPLALVMGYMLADNPTGFTTIGVVGLVSLVIISPLLLRYHHAIVFLTWNMTAVAFFLPGSMQLWIPAVFLSLTLSILQRTLLREMRFLHAPSIFWPLALMAVVIYFTAKMTGGFGVKALGGETYGGKRYLVMLAAIVGYFAMSARQIPPSKVVLYIGLFFLGSLANVISNIIVYGPHWLYPLALIFPVTSNDLGSMAGALGLQQGPEEGVARFFGLMNACSLLLCYLLARWGIRDLFEQKRLGRLLLLVLILAVGSLGGFRSFIATSALLFAALAYLEGLHRTRWAVLVVGIGILGGALLLPLADKLPISVQRTLSFLPVEIDQSARTDAENSSRWRFHIWEIVLPEVPKYLWLGRGLSVDGRALDTMVELDRTHRGIPYENVLLSGDYHSGPLTLIIGFGIWGVIAWLWLTIAGLRALYLNRRYGEESLRKLNTFLLAYFITRALVFFGIYGHAHVDLAYFTSILGFSIALNGGVRKPAAATAGVAQPVRSGIRKPAANRGSALPARP